ncbi:MAG: DUF177 domain-containing protein [Clostridiales bacterium]|nr:DUF177 domain-containing protein [Clostridiales bacterium]
MIVDVEKLRAGARLDVAFTKTYRIPEEYGLIGNSADARVTGHIAEEAGRYVFEAEAEASFRAECSRCLTPVRAGAAFKFRSVFATEPEKEDYDDVYPVADGKADLSAAAVSNLLIEIPVKFLCSKDCKGLCPVCGANLNDDPGHGHSPPQDA